MDWDSAALIITLIVGAIFLIMHTTAFVLSLTAKGPGIDNFRSIMLHIAFVAGLTAFLYLSNLGTGDQRIRWLAYALCSSVLLLTAYEYYSGHSPRRPYPPLVWATVVATLISVGSGYFIAEQGLTDALLYVGYAAAFVPFIFIPFLLCAALKQATQGEVGFPTTLIYFGIFWLAYPIIYVLSPIGTSTLSLRQAQFFYVLADIATKVIYETLFGYWAYRAWVCPKKGGYESEEDYDIPSLPRESKNQARKRKTLLRTDNNQYV